MIEYEKMVHELVSRKCKSINDEYIINLLHAGMGMMTEIGEFMDQLKKYLFYGTKLDKINLKEELGDIEFYQTLARMVLGYTEDDVIQANMSKLRIRYPEKFTKEQAVNRDLKAERKVLEGTDICNDCHKKGKCPLRVGLAYVLTECDEKFSGRNCSTCLYKPTVAMTLCGQGHDVNKQPYTGINDCKDHGRIK